MKTNTDHRVPLTNQMVSHSRAIASHAMLMLLRRMKVEGVTVHGFRSSFRVGPSEVVNAPGEVAEMSLSHSIGISVIIKYLK